MLQVIWGLNLSSNLLSGDIPQSICDLTSLQVLDLCSNHLTGTIPSALNHLHFLSEFNISNNELQGPIPVGGQISTFQSSSFDGNSRLCGPVLNRRCASVEATPVSIVSVYVLQYLFHPAIRAHCSPSAITNFFFCLHLALIF